MEDGPQVQYYKYMIVVVMIVMIVIPDIKAMLDNVRNIYPEVFLAAKAAL